MDRAAALASLPAAYGKALQLRDAGYGPDEIASRLQIEPAAALNALELAEAKLARLLADEVHDGERVREDRRNHEPP